ncbi:MAG: carboxypeptidase-like regulatory domain-containing protein [Bacteroidetes bacterium]|nr:MAG: carboxypeptidase-like regulatory domain-containing protein [Bacteroidota bacterium]
MNAHKPGLCPSLNGFDVSFFYLYVLLVKNFPLYCRSLLLLNLLILLGYLPLKAQLTRVEGVVTDASTHQPLAFVKVILHGTTAGTLTDSSGYFQLSTTKMPDSLRFTSIGYLPLTVAIQPGTSQRIEVALQPHDYTLEEVVIVPEDTENPAHAILRKVWAHKKQNDRDQLDAYQYEAYTKTEFGMKGVDEQFKKQMLLGAFDFIMDYVDTVEGEDYLPMMMVESLSDIYYRKKPKARRENIKATQISGVENASISQWMGDMHHFTNIYDNRLELLGRQFVSPISDHGLGFYRYTLIDSAWVDSRWCYEIEFRPKRKQEPTFIGSMWIDKATYGVKEFDMRIAGDANINYITGIRLVQVLELVEEHAWMLGREEMYVDGEVPVPHLAKNQPFHGKRLASYRNFVINRPRPNEFYAVKFRQTIAPEAMSRTAAYWEEMRHEALSPREESVYVMVDSVKNTPFFRLLKTLARGYVKTGPIEWGPFFSLYSYNPVEEHRFRFGARTNQQFSKTSQLEGYVAYGTLDREWKYGGTLRHFLSKQPRQMFTLAYRHDVEQLGRSSSAVLRQDNVLNTLFSRNPLDKMNMIDEVKLEYEREWLPGFSHRLQLTHKRLSPRGNLFYQHKNQDGSIVPVASLSTTELSLHLHWGIKESFLEHEFTRVSLGSYSPIFDAIYTKGVSGVLGSQYDYHKLGLGVRQTFRMGILGELKTRLEGGKIWGALPYPLLEIHNGNETFFYDELAFNSMNFFEFVSDEYASAAVSWYPQGLLFNRIPLLRKLKWREVVSAKAAIGRLNPQSATQLLLPENMYGLNKPFVEGSLGVTNIFTFARVDALWRLTHLHHPGVVKFGIFVTAEFGL